MSEVKNILIIDDSRVSRMMVKGIAKQEYPDAIIYEAGNAEETPQYLYHPSYRKYSSHNTKQG